MNEMTEKDYSHLEGVVSTLNKMFEISAIAGQAVDVNDLIIKMSDLISATINNNQISFYLFENAVFKSVITNQNARLDEYFEYENEAFWSIMSKGNIIKTTNENHHQVFHSFWQNNGLSSLEAQYIRVFFDKEKNMPVCICFIGKNNDGSTEIDEENLSFLTKVFEYMEPVIVKLLHKKSQDDKIQELQKSLYNISILYNISQAVNFIDDLKRLLQIILSKALTTLEAEKGSLMLYDYTSNSLQVKVVYGLNDKRVEENINNGLIQCSQIKAGEGVAGTVFLEKKAIITNLGSNDPRFVNKDSLPNVQSLLCVPLIAKGETIGVINISNKKNDKLFNQRDLEFMTSLSNQAAIAIDNAKLYELATKDGLTKLYISRHFYTLLENEIRRCSRYKHKMSLLMMDIDNFKRINDTYGHLIGDQILRELSNEISQTVRKIDIPARYGGEEFIVILPETTKEDAIVIAERLRINISKIKVRAKDDIFISPTISSGICQYPMDGEDAKTLINSADTALYHSKNNGKNVVSLFSQEGCTLVPREEDK